MYSVGQWWMWVGFFVFIVVMLAIDIFAFSGKKSHKVGWREALIWSMVWISCAFIFGGLLWWYLNSTLGATIANEKTLQFFTGFVIEKSLSVDNLFIFVMIFSFFHVPEEYQRRVLLYGVLGAVIMRLIMISLGTLLVSQFHWVLYLFGAFLIYSGIKMFFVDEEVKDLSNNTLLRWLRGHMRITHEYHAEKFFIKQGALYYATPLFLVLILVEISDLIFALDSIPAIFAITQDPFIVFTSNIFAILGLRALFFLLANMANRFHLLKYGIAIVLAFVGLKMLMDYWFEIPTVFALAVVVAILMTSVILSAVFPKIRKR